MSPQSRLSLGFCAKSPPPQNKYDLHIQQMHSKSDVNQRISLLEETILMNVNTTQEYFTAGKINGRFVGNGTSTNPQDIIQTLYKTEKGIKTLSSSGSQSDWLQDHTSSPTTIFKGLVLSHGVMIFLINITFLSLEITLKIRVTSYMQVFQACGKHWFQ